MNKDELIQAAKEQMVKVASNLVTAPMETAKIVGSPYDPNRPVQPVIDMIYNIDTVEPGDDYEYFVVDDDVKQVHTLAVDGNVTSVEVTPNTELTLTFAELTSPEFFITLANLTDAKYDVLARKRDNIRRALDNRDVQKALEVVDAAVPVANKHTLVTGRTKFNFDDLCKMTEDVANHGEKLVLIAGTNVNKDIVLWNFDNDKNQAISPADLGVEVVVVRGKVKLDAGLDGVILNPNVAYLVATSDVIGSKPGYFVRKKISSLIATDGTERATLPTSPIMAIGANRKMAFAIVGYERVGCVITNPFTLSRFERV